ncbi:hypothetical protein [Alteromonas lipotrueae]|uniref:hypothetical protein n=1 Tax=Alteromonas lipotrueae TaxID=2803814 RepID=UPI001C439699|nr:hypothetical protein [Alteromonas lipotrueae]
MDLLDLIEHVNDEESFLAFAKALEEDKRDESEKEKRKTSNIYSHGANGWQNASIEDFLESAIAFAEDNATWQIETNLWKKFALFLLGGKIYE